MRSVKIGKVIGNVVASVKDPGLDGLRLLIIQDLDDNLNPKGSPYVAADGIRTAGPDDIVNIVSKKEAAKSISMDLIPIDESVVGFIDEYTIVKQALKKKTTKQKPQPKKKTKSKKPPPTIVKEAIPIESIKTKTPTVEKTITTKTPSTKKRGPKKRTTKKAGR